MIRTSIFALAAALLPVTASAQSAHSHHASKPAPTKAAKPKPAAHAGHAAKPATAKPKAPAHAGHAAKPATKPAAKPVAKPVAKPASKPQPAAHAHHAARPAATSEHSGHAASQVEDPHAGHAMPAPVEADPHAGHVMPAPVETDPHAGHVMPAPTTADPHAGHAMPTPATADPHAGHAAPSGHAELPKSGPPPRALEGPLHAADAIWGESEMARARAVMAADHGRFRGGAVMLERLEARIADGEDAYLWDAQGWYGGDLTKLWLKTEGEGEWGESVEDAEFQALLSRAIGPFFDLQAGVRLDLEPETRTHLALGVQGLAPYMFEVDAAAFLSDRGDLTARVEAEYDQRITQRLILQPRAELEFSVQDVPERGLGSGLTALEAGLRLRYEIVREFAPYVGVEYEAKIGETADIARAAGADPDGVRLLVGLRAWF